MPCKASNDDNDRQSNTAERSPTMKSEEIKETHHAPRTVWLNNGLKDKCKIIQCVRDKCPEGKRKNAPMKKRYTLAKTL
jgi:hypothetical protein